MISLSTVILLITITSRTKPIDGFVPALRRSCILQLSKHDFVKNNHNNINTILLRSNYDDDDDETANTSTGMSEATSSISNNEPLRTLSGGPSEIFSMARRMMVWNEDFGYSSTSSSTSSSSTSSTSSLSKPLPRWHPHEGIADSNPSFRSKPPLMNNKGFALLIRRNSRKRNKQSLWRHAYRTYNKMKAIEEEQSTGNGSSSKIVIMRHVLHYEAALVSCAKLGLWREALNIFQEVEDKMEKQKLQSTTIANAAMETSSTTTAPTTMKRKTSKIIVTDNMILSIISACVRGSKIKDEGEDNQSQNNINNKIISIQKRREPLDIARNILLSMEEKYNLPLVSRHVNKLAAAYHKLGLYSDGSKLITENLADRKTQAQDREEEEPPSFNLNDVKAKDSASYNILIQGAIQGGDWGLAIGSLRQMTDKGLYPESRSLNRWSETAQKRERRAGSRKTTWKKNRERLITRTLPVSLDGNK